MIPLIVAALCAATGQEARPNSSAPPRRETVVVTGTYGPVPVEEADRAIAVEDVASRTQVANTLADFLKLDPSLDLRQRAPNGIQADLSIRGSTFGQTLILLDGQRMNDAQSGHHNLDLPVPLESVERVEILRGSGSTLYGSDAVGGVVNFITRQPEAFVARLRGALGNFGVNQERADFSFAGSRWSQSLAVSRDFSTGFIPNRDYRNLTAWSDSRVRTKLGWSTVSLGYADKPFGAQGFYGNFPSWEDTKSWVASGRQQIGSKTDASFTYRRHSDLFVLYRDRPQVYHNHHASESWIGAVRRQDEIRPNVRVFYGAEGFRDAIVSTNLGTHSRGRVAAYGALDIRALRRFSFNIGAREEVYGSLASQFSPSVSAGYWLSPSWKLRGSVSRAFRIPTYTELYYRDPANIGNPALRPERAWSYEGALDWNSGRARASVGVFQRRETDGVDYFRVSPADPWRAENIQKLRFTGIEASAGWRLPGNQSLDFRYAGIRGRADSLGAFQSKYVFHYPVHSGFAQWQGSLGREILARVRCGALQRLGRSPYAVLDVYAGRTRGRIQPFLQLTNLAGATYEEIPGVAMPGRAVVGGITLQFGGR